MNDKFDNIENIVFSVNEDEEEKKMRQENLKYEDNSRNSLIDARNLKGVTIGLSVVTFVAVLLIALKTLKASPGVPCITLVMVYFLNWTLALFHSIPQSLLGWPPSWSTTITFRTCLASLRKEPRRPTLPKTLCSKTLRTRTRPSRFFETRLRFRRENDRHLRHPVGAERRPS